MEDQVLIQAARQARQMAYVPYSHFAVGAALLTASGRIFTGCNIENASYGLTNCAERTAIFKAVSEGETQFVTLAIVADTDGPVSPCGACRQVMNEFSPDLRVIQSNLRGETTVTTAQALLPGAFRDSDMASKG